MDETTLDVEPIEDAFLDEALLAIDEGQFQLDGGPEAEAERLLCEILIALQLSPHMFD